MVDDNSPDGTQEIAKQLAKVYGEDKIVSISMDFIEALLTRIIGS